MQLYNGLLCVVVWLNLSSSVLAFSEGYQKKVSVSEVTIDSSVEDIQWCGNEYRTVLLKSKTGRLYRSKDSGKQWTEITDLLTSGSGGPLAQVTVESIIVSPSNKNVVAIIGNRKNHFVTEDSANTFRRVEHNFSIHSWVFHPIRPRWALASAWTDACFTPKTGTECSHMLYMTRDLGQSFVPVSSYIVQFSWGDKTREQSDRIYFTHYKNPKGEQPRSGGWSKFVDFSVTYDGGKSSKVLVAKGNKFLVSNGFIFVAKLDDPVKQTVRMLVCSDGTETFQMAQFPKDNDDVLEKSYTILDTSEGAIMLHVNHGVEGRSNTGNVYISDATGLRYTLSLPNNVRTMSGECEFDKVTSLDGVFIANFKDNIEMSDGMESRLESDIANTIEEDALETATDKKRKHKNRAKLEQVERTVISFNKGSKWSFLTPPKVDSHGKPIECGSADQCWLHLHGITNFHQYAPFYSVESAVGLIMGTGNVGSYLRYEPDEVNTYLSRDGGLTWVEAHSGANIYEFGDHGGVLVLADDVRKTKQVVFSWNEGHNWYDFELGQYALDVDNIVIEPNSSSVEFLLYGTRGSVGIVYHLDFGALGQPPCRNVYGADSVSSDYETWTPSDGRGGGAKCILGREITYTRRKQTSECFNGKDFNRPIVKKNCECTKDDYECELGFARRVGSLECKPKENAFTAEGCTSASYFYTNAYRKIPGDSCVGGWVAEKVAVPCSTRSPFSRGARMVLLCIVGIACVMFIITISSKYPGLKRLFKNYGFESFVNVQYSILGGTRRRKGSEDIYLDTVASSKYEPELGFIDTEQDENEEDAPTLLSYSANRNQTEFPLDDDEEIEKQRLPIASTSTVRRTPDNLARDPVPRLAPPPGSSAPVEEEGTELL